MLTVPSDHPQSSFINKNPTPRKTVEMPPDSSSLPVVQSRDLGHLRRTSAAPGAGNFVSRPRHLPTKQGSIHWAADANADVLIPFHALVAFGLILEVQYTRK